MIRVRFEIEVECEAERLEDVTGPLVELLVPLDDDTRFRLDLVRISLVRTIG